MKPTIYLSNWGSYRTPGHHGPGQKLTIMVAPREWEWGQGTVSAFVPPWTEVKAHKEGRRSDADLAAILRQRWGMLPQQSYAPGHLVKAVNQGTRPVADGDTLCCSCARGKFCHRRVAAEILVHTGWRVILDGEEVGPEFRA